MKNLFAAFAFLAISFTIQGQNLKTTIKVQAMDMARALVSNDFNSFLKYVHPEIMEHAEGKEKMKSRMDSAAAAMKQFGVSFKKILIGDPGEIINYKKQLQCVVPESTDMQSVLGEMHVETSLIAISADNGKTWYFIDTNIYKVDKIKMALPDLSPHLVIPAQQKPKFTPNANN